MKKTILLIMLLLLSTFAIASNDDFLLGTGGQNSLGTNNDSDDNDTEDEIELEENETDDEMALEVESEDENEIESEDETEGDNKTGESKKLNQRIRENVAAGFSVQAQQQLRQRFNNISEEDKDELKSKLAEMKQEFLQKKQEIRNQVQANREEARAAVDALRLAGNFTGTDIAEIMHNYNEELKETLKSEEQIGNRSRIARFFAGGDEKVAARLELQIGRNNERIEEVTLRLEEIEDEELKAELEEHLATLERNQERLKNVAETEKKSKGVFGWIWK